MLGRLNRFRPYTLHILLAIYVPLGLYEDAHALNIGQQDLLGVGTLVLLVSVAQFSPRDERRQVWLMVAIATCVEVGCSMVWGLYRYRFDNVPLYVPPGHGLIYLFALRWARTPLMLKHSPLLTRLALWCAGIWALGGLTIEPLMLGRLDVGGALLFPIFFWFMRGPSAPIYAGAFLATSCMELVGTGLGTWHWLVLAPATHIPMGNPPSVIAGAYCLIDFAATRGAVLLKTDSSIPRFLSGLRPAGGRTATSEL